MNIATRSVALTLRGVSRYKPALRARGGVAAQPLRGRLRLHYVLCLIEKCAAQLRFNIEGCGDGATHAKHARGLSPLVEFQQVHHIRPRNRRIRNG